MAFFSSCGEKKAKDGRTDTPTSGTIEFVADESLSPIIDEERISLSMSSRKLNSSRSIQMKSPDFR